MCEPWCGTQVCGSDWGDYADLKIWRQAGCLSYETWPQESGGGFLVTWQTDCMNDYERIARVIRYLDEHQAEQPDLAALARRAGLSPFHFHRLFSQWAGVTPKDFVQCLTFARVKESLQAGKTILDSALDAGLSGPGRAHDLCVNLEAASPGEMKSGGAGWTLTAGFAETPFGIALIAESPRGICHLAFVEPEEKDPAWEELHANWPNARLRRNDAAAAKIAAQVFARRTGRSRRTLRAFVQGTPFQLRVWRALVRIPAGEVTTYGRLAVTLGNPKAARAVGSAVGANALAYLIPCHRVIRETGVIGEYRWGPVRKRALVAWENAARRA
jgi:AraC family transcriptional regulator, regulatory protein of adaptative response / methylated-DNA-[protein]-cysteine methyltransferase